MIMLFAILLATVTFGQVNFKWDKVDSVDKTKAQIYSDTKLFIAKTWNSAQSVIQNDDKEAGNILIKGLLIKEMVSGRGISAQVFGYVYDYTIIFMMKDGKYKIIIDNVSCTKAYFKANPTYKIALIQPFDGIDNCPETGTWKNLGVSKETAVRMIGEIKLELQNIVDDYLKTIKMASTTNSGW